MTFPAELDFDRIMLELLKSIDGALVGWIKGGLHTEEPLMNRLIEPFNRSRRGCDVGGAYPVRMTSAVALLHRKGDRQTDAFGADLAVTVDVPTTGFRKTALFQLKVSDGMMATLQREQLESAHAHALTRERSVVLVVDRSRKRTRVRPTHEVLGQFQPQASTHTATCTDWEGLAQWAGRWLSCETGVASDSTQFGGVEGLLQDFVVESPSEWDSPWGSLDDPGSMPEAWRPAKAWLVLEFTPRKPEIKVR